MYQYITLKSMSWADMLHAVEMDIAEEMTKVTWIQHTFIEYVLFLFSY